MKHPMRIIPLGGLGEVGLNIMVLECGDDIVIIDCGVLFPDLYWMGLELVLPDITYLRNNADKIRGLVVTHGHEDHIGAIPFLLKDIKVPIIYCSRFASRLIEDKCSEHGVLKELLIYGVKAGDKHELGCFEVEFIHVTHSTLESFALAIQTPHGLIIHSGDFKFDETPYVGPASDKARFKALGKEKPLLLMSDSTNSEKCGHSLSESAINSELSRLITSAPEAVVVALFASNVYRIQQLLDIALKAGRKVFLSGRSMERYTQIAIEEGFLNFDISLLNPLENISKFNRNEILVLSTGSQGESRSSLLRLAKNENRFLKLQPQDTVILSSRNIPGNERAISFVVNQLCRLGVTVHYEDMVNVHVSGHAYQEEQVELLKLVKPRFFIPIHGEYRHLVLHGKTARESGYVSEEVSVIENGTVWEFDSKVNGAHIKENVSVGRRWVFGGATGELDHPSIKERRAAARGGVVVIDCLVSKKGIELVRSPQFTLNGFLGDENLKEVILDALKTQCEQAFENWSPHNTDNLTREQTVAAAARRVFKRALDLKPLIIVNFLSV